MRVISFDRACQLLGGAATVLPRISELVNSRVATRLRLGALAKVEDRPGCRVNPGLLLWLGWTRLCRLGPGGGRNLCSRNLTQVSGGRHSGHDARYC